MANKAQHIQFDEKQSRVGADESGQTLAAKVRNMYVEMPWSKARKLIATGRVKVDEKLLFDSTQRMKEGELVEVNPIGRRRRVAPLEESRVLFIDNDIVVVNKPAGLPSVSSEDQNSDSLQSRTLTLLLENPRLAAAKSEQKGITRAAKAQWLGVVHRLDDESSGIMVFARNRRARKDLDLQFQEQKGTRRFLALVHGEAKAKTHKSLLVADRGDGRRGSWKGSNPPRNARMSVSHVHIEERFSKVTLIACQVETSRKHQIRIHLAESGTPLVGESLYMYGPRPQISSSAIERPMLHASFLAFTHPGTNRPLVFSSQLPEDFEGLLTELRQDSKDS